MAAGFKDLLAWLLAWKSAHTSWNINGPYGCVAGQNCVLGAVAGQNYVPGAVAEQVSMAGAEEGQIDA